MNTLMIHDVGKEYFDLNLDQYLLTFDDGLFSQYYYYPVLGDNKSKRLYFITTSFIKPGKIRNMFNGQHIPRLKSKTYMYATLIKGEYDHFMTVEELQALSSFKNVIIGAHSHFHDVILTGTHPKKKKRPSKWKRERFQNHPIISEKNLSIRSKLAFQGFNLQNDQIVRRSEAEWEDYIKLDTELCLKWF